MNRLLSLPLLAAFCSGMVVNKAGQPLGIETCNCPSQQQYYFGGSLPSPGWKGSIGNSRYCGPLECTYTLNAVTGQRVRVNFASFMTEEKYDNLTIYDSDKADGEQVLAVLSGTTKPARALVSGGQKLTLVFRTDFGDNNGGFFLQWESTSDNGCNIGTQPGQGGTIFTTPNYPYNYPHLANCTWSFNATSGDLAQVAFAHDADTEQGFDQVIIRGGTVQDSYSGPWSASNYKPVISSNRLMSVQFRSDDAKTYKGFQATFSSYSPPTSCDCGPQVHTLTVATQTITITSPNFGSDEYCINAQCQWVVRVPDNYKAHIHFPSFDLERHYDTLSLRNDVSGSQLELCTGTSCNDAQSSTNFMTLVFHTDSSVNKAGFQAIITAV